MVECKDSESRGLWFLPYLDYHDIFTLQRTDDVGDLLFY